MNITQSYVSLFFFWLGSCQLGFKGISLRTQTLSFLNFCCFQYFRGIHWLKFSITCVFVPVFVFCILFLRGDKHGCLISEICTWQNFCLKITIWISRTLLWRHLENICKWGVISLTLWSTLMLNIFLNGQWSARYPCSTRLHTRSPHTKRKKKEK